MTLNEKYGWLIALVILWAFPLGSGISLYFTNDFNRDGMAELLVIWPTISCTGLYLIALLFRHIYLAGRNAR